MKSFRFIFYFCYVIIVMTNLNSDNCLRTLYARAGALDARSKTAETHVSNKAATLVSVAFSFPGGKFKCNN